MHLSALRNVENKQFLEKKLIQVLVWPGNSPDLNPVENLWSLMKHKVSKKIIFYGCSTEKCNKEVWVKDVAWLLSQPSQQHAMSAGNRNKEWRRTYKIKCFQSDLFVKTLYIFLSNLSCLQFKIVYKNVEYTVKPLFHRHGALFFNPSFIVPFY